ncbi:MAG: glycosyltransferase family 2 protein [Anaerolineales bacterium]|nr:glycosyltransferase family 2 protein [Anaerolineales bacterium]
MLHLAALAAASVLLAFSLRRAALLAAAVAPALPRRSASAAAEPAPLLPPVTALIPCRDEAASLSALFAALDALDYPRGRLRAALINDGSADASAQLARGWSAARPWARVIELPASHGKAQALNQALEALPPLGGEIVVVYDADHQPDPGSLRALVAPLTDPRVAGASGQMRVVNGAASPAAAYAAIESLVHQFITMRAKDRLDLAPALLGSNVAYRRSALADVGGFTRGALLEDTDLTLAFALAGWRTRFADASVSRHRAPVSVRGYVRQHLRWNRGFHQAGGGRLPGLWRGPRLSPLLKLELAFFALGYADRLALLAGGLFTLLDAWRPGTAGFPRIVWLAYFGVPALEMAAALRLAGEPLAAFGRLAVVPFFFALDIAVAAWSALASVLRRPVRWTATERTA